MSKYQSVLKYLAFCASPIAILLLCWDIYNAPGLQIEFIVKQVSQIAGGSVTQISLQHNLAAFAWWILMLVFDCWLIHAFADVWKPLFQKFQKKD
jgi:hypothetical protein